MHACMLFATVNITAGEVSDNLVAFNRVVATGPETPAIVLNVVYRGAGPMPDEILYDNTVIFNDLRGSTNPIVIDPPELEQANTILWNRQ